MTYLDVKEKILFLGQFPPPYYGQAISHDALINAQFDRIQLYPVRMAFSDTIDSVGKVQLQKIFHIFRLIYQVLKTKYKYNIDSLFYPPASPYLVPVLRDIVLLGIIRPFFKNLILSFSAAGLSEYVESRTKLFKWMAYKIYKNPTCAMQRSMLNPKDGEYFNSKYIFPTQGGVSDKYPKFGTISKPRRKMVKLLYVGMMHESKGVMILLKAIKILKDKGIQFNVSFMGDFTSMKLKKDVLSYISHHNLDEEVILLGAKIGDEKWRIYSSADINCFPTFYEAEAFGLVAIEALMFGNPVVATNWRGLPEIIEDGETGYLVPIKDEKALSEKLEVLIKDHELRKRFGQNARKKYLREYTVEKFTERFETAVIKSLQIDHNIDEE